MSTIAMSKNPVFHFIRDLISEGEIIMEFINTNGHPDDILAKAVTLERLEKFKKQLKITN